MRALHRPGIRELVPLAALVLFVCALVVELLAPLARREGPPPAAYLAALEAHRAELKPGTRVLVQPPWRDDVLDALPPKLSATLALSLGHGADPGRVLILADPDQPLPRAHLRRARALARGAVDVYLIATPRPEGALLLDELISAADVHVVDEGGRRTDCRWDPGTQRHTCPGLPEWMWVGSTSVQSGRDNRRCLWSHPTSKGQVVTRFPARVLPDGEVVLRHALRHRVATSGAPVSATVKLDGKVLGRAVRDTQRGFREHRYRLPRSDQPRSLEVVVETKNAGARHYCFSLAVEPQGSAQ